MSEHEFKGWDEIDGSEITSEEIESAFDQVMATARALEQAHLQKSAARKRRLLRWTLACAAAIAVLALVPAGIRIFSGMQEKQTAEMLLSESTLRGEIREIMLPDSSKVTLNAGSTLKYPRRFGDERVVELSGEALFAVVSSPEHPFIVNAGEISVTAMGTIFNINAYPDGETTEAALCEGTVKVERKEAESQEAVLQPGQKYTLTNSTGAVAVVPASTEDVTAWKDGHLCILSQPLSQVLLMIGRRFDVDIHLDSDKYDKAILTAKFINGESLEEVIAAISCLVPGMEYTIEEKDIYIR